ncbi:DUF1540 domain-containing protein [Romboutsia sp. 1001216sp1]|uniref:DUF1540 domain-containing protein n=1 Tax=unclassified Romboutsia TaxID=2626894 RepID=UPI0018AA52FA|nr:MULTISPECIES: DUF1540 domain-containing protein [unclassified Romboutsia]MDB8792617.1 DUF1540 domain-containing protein [Romboutsia sp. 1001216sp1]MDB8796216.1 DUF1540 domain-containing protein [Romboutsia sp. 1001216sp1]MDB8798209.1 DUF1540 domain-containing protein [Romboutsia sp. 1001216sp1]
MQSGNLKCNATDCIHNINYDCKAGAIHVSGLGAVEVKGTSCTSFVDRESSSLANSLAGSPNEKESFFNSSNNSFVNSTGDSTTKPSDIKCEAHNCRYNENKKCHAEYVEIDKVDAYCNSFDYGGHI